MARLKITDLRPSSQRKLAYYIKIICILTYTQWRLVTLYNGGATCMLIASQCVHEAHSIAHITHINLILMHIYVFNHKKTLLCQLCTTILRPQNAASQLLLKNKTVINILKTIFAMHVINNQSLKIMHE